MQAPKMTYLCIYNYKNDVSKGGRTCSPWTWLGQEWPLWQIWTDFGQSGAMMAWRISPRWVWEILFSFDFTTFVSGWDVQPWRRLLVLRCQHGVPRRRRWCWGDPNGLSQPHSCTWSQWWSRWSESTTIVHFVPMIPLIRMIPLVNKPHRRTAQLYPPYQWNPISGTASQLCIFSCKLSVIHNFEPSPLKFGPQNKSCQNQNELFSEFCLLENCCKT